MYWPLNLPSPLMLKHQGGGEPIRAGNVTPKISTHIGDQLGGGKQRTKTIKTAKATLPTQRAGTIGGGKTRVEITHISGTNPRPSKTIAQMGNARVRSWMMGEKHVTTAEGASLD